jgi:hypothetical protein
MPRTEKRIVSSQGRYQSQNLNMNNICTPENNGMERK